jgi:mono/diheme cytochrome c family protein
LIHKLGFAFAATILAFIVLLAVAQSDGPPQAVDDVLFTQGQELFEANCAICHQTSGLGTPPIFPALAGNEALENVDLIVGNIHEGQGAMPAFPHLGAEEVAALTTYVRNSWGNAFGGIDPDHVASQITARDTLVSVWEGVYTFAQAERGESLYSGECSECHGFLWVSSGAPSVAAAPPPGGNLIALAIGGERVDMSNPPVAPSLDDDNFLQRWEGQTLSSLYLFVRQSMPQENPGTLSDQMYTDIIAFLLAINDFPEGEQELAPDTTALSDILLQRSTSE